MTGRSEVEKSATRMAMRGNHKGRLDYGTILTHLTGVRKTRTNGGGGPHSVSRVIVQRMFPRPLFS